MDTGAAAAEATVGADPGLLVRRAQNGDIGAFEALYRMHVGRIHAFAVRLTGSAAAGEELTQQAFVRAWRRLGMFRGEAAFATWLHRLTVNLFLDERRRASSRGADVALELADQVPARCLPDPSAGLDLERAIAALPPGARTVFVMHDVEGWGHAEIAATTGIAVGTSKAQLHRARALLREVLSP
ncbi:MAG: RNA polymerase sigma factor [Acidobacteriota bacterium]